MAKRDALAQGARKATYAVSDKAQVGAEVEIKNVMSEGDRIAAEQEAAELQQKLAEVKPIERKRFIPLGATILVRRAQATDPTGILLTESLEKDAPAEGTVLEVGPEVESLHVNDYIVFGKYAGAEFRLNGEVLLLMESNEVKGTLVPEESYDNNTACSAMASTIGRA